MGATPIGLAFSVFSWRSTMQLLNTAQDLDWLRTTHLVPFNARLLNVPQVKSAMIEGNEDCPDKITLFRVPDPLVTDQPVAVLTLNENLVDSVMDGVYSFTSRFEQR